MGNIKNITDRLYLLVRPDLLRIRNIKFLIGTLILLFGLSLMTLLHRGQPGNTQITLQILGCLISAGGTLILVSTIRNYNIRLEPAIQVLEKKPENVVWVYPHIVVNMPFGIRLMKMATLFIMLEDKDFHTIQIREQKVDKTMNLLRELLPHATFGHSVEKEQLYKADPSLLRRDN